MRTLPALTIGLLAVLSALPAAASPATVAQGLAAGTVIPHFRAVAQAAHAQSAAWSGFCAHRTTGDVEGLRAAFHPQRPSRRCPAASVTHAGRP